MCFCRIRLSLPVWKQLYELDEEYTDYPKVAARIISKDPGNWYDTFMINRGSNDGIAWTQLY